MALKKQNLTTKVDMHQQTKRYYNTKPALVRRLSRKWTWPVLIATGIILGRLL